MNTIEIKNESITLPLSVNEREFIKFPDMRVIGKRQPSKQEFQAFKQEFEEVWKHELDSLPKLITNATLHIDYDFKAGKYRDTCKTIIGYITPKDTPVPKGFQYLDFPSHLSVKGLPFDSYDSIDEGITETGYWCAHGHYIPKCERQEANIGLYIDNALVPISQESERKVVASHILSKVVSNEWNVYYKKIRGFKYDTPIGNINDLDGIVVQCLSEERLSEERDFLEQFRQKKDKCEYTPKIFADKNNESLILSYQMKDENGHYHTWLISFDVRKKEVRLSVTSRLTPLNGWSSVYDLSFSLEEYILKTLFGEASDVKLAPPKEEPLPIIVNNPAEQKSQPTETEEDKKPNINDEYYIIVGGDSLTYSVKQQPEYAGLDRNLYVLKEPMEPFEAPLELFKHYGSPKGNMDYYSLSGGYHIISQRIYDILQRFNPPNIGYLPANITLRKKVYPNYYILQIYNNIECMDKTKSVWTKNPNYKPEQDPPKREIKRIHKFQLDEAKLNAIPLEQRRIITMKHCVFETLFHESIINEMEKIKPKGFYVMSLNEWKDDVFDEF